MDAATEIVVREEEPPEAGDNDGYCPSASAIEGKNSRRVIVELVTRLLGGGDRLRLKDSAAMAFEFAFDRRPSPHATELLAESLASIGLPGGSVALSVACRDSDPLHEWLRDYEWNLRPGALELLKSLLYEFGASDEDICGAYKGSGIFG